MRPSLKARRKFNARGFLSASSSSKSNERVHDAAFGLRYGGGMLNWSALDWITAAATVGIILLIVAVSWQRGR
jgi:hypothetical protein